MSSSLVFLVPLALLLGGMALLAFLWSLRNGQYDDLDGAAQRVLLDEEEGLDDRPSGSTAAEETGTRAWREVRSARRVAGLRLGRSAAADS